MTGFWVVLLGGLVLLAVAALRDRQTRIRAERTLGAPVSQVHSRQPATPDATQQAALASFRERAQPVEARLADERFASALALGSAGLPVDDMMEVRLSVRSG